jgi:GTP-binding protein HflX
LLLHVIDATSPRMEDQIKTVEQVLERLDLTAKPVVLVLNKTDLLDPEEAAALQKRTGGVAVSAIHPPTLLPLIDRVEAAIWPGGTTHRT